MKKFLILWIIVAIAIHPVSGQEFVQTESINHDNPNIGEVRIEEPYHQTTTIKIEENEITKLKINVDTIDDKEKYFLIAADTADVFSHQGNLSLKINGKEKDLEKDKFISKNWITMNLTKTNNEVIISPEEVVGSNGNGIIGWVRIQLLRNPIAILGGLIAIIFAIGGFISYRDNDLLSYKK